MLYDERDFTPRRYQVLLAAKPVGKREHGRVWMNRGEAYMLTASGRIETVTSVTDWLQAVKLLEPGPLRSLRGKFLIPSIAGLEKLETTLRPGHTAPGNKEEK